MIKGKQAMASRNAPLLQEDNLRNSGGNVKRRSNCPKTWKVAVALLLVCALFLTGVVIGYLVSRTGTFAQQGTGGCEKQGIIGKAQLESSATLSNGDPVSSDDPRLLEQAHWNLVEFLGSTDHRLTSELVDFASVPVHSGSKHDRELHDIIFDEFATLRFDETSVETYNVLLSFPDIQKPNFVRIFQNSNTSQNIASEGIDGNIKHVRALGFVGYSPSADVTGELVYLNYGTVEDFNLIRGQNLSGKLALMKLGHSSVEEKISAAAFHQMAGLLLFEETVDSDHRPKKCDSVPPHVVIRSAGGSDPLTPGFPAIDGMWQSTPDCAKVPTLPVRTLSCQTVRSILPFIRSNSTDRQGSPIGQSLSVQLVVNAKLVTKPIHNIIATIYGEKDPDQMVLIGASRNGPYPGDGLNGTSSILKLARGLSQMFHNKTQEWIPKRTIRLVSWGGADVNDMGMVEFLEKYAEVWQNNVVAYINLDRPYEIKKSKSSSDDDSFIVLSVNPSLENLVRVLTAQLREDKEPSLPTISSNRQLQKVSSHPFRQLFGSAYVHIQMTLDDDLSSPDEESAASSAVCQLAAIVSVTLADSGVLPLQLNRTVQELVGLIHKMIKAYKPAMPNATIDAFHMAGNQLKKSAIALDTYVTHHLMFQKLEDIRTVNSVIVHFDSLLGRLMHQISVLIEHKQSYPAVAAGSQPMSIDHTVDEGCGAGVVSRSGLLISEEVSMLLTRLFAASRVISLNI